MANEPIFGREALRRFREEQARKEKSAQAAAAKGQMAKLAGKQPARRQVQWKVTAGLDEDAKFRKLARAAGLTLSNCIRKRCGMPPIRPGRPRLQRN